MARSKLLIVPTVLSDAQARDQPRIDYDTYRDVKRLRALEKINDTLNRRWQEADNHRALEGIADKNGGRLMIAQWPGGPETEMRLGDIEG